MKVREVMTAWPITVTPDATLEQAVEEMLRRRVRGLPVCDDAGALVGMLTDRDVRMALGPSARELDLVSLTGDALGDTVFEWMTAGAAAISNEVDLGVACRAILAARVGAMPVVDAEGVVVGILSTSDLLEVAADLFDDLAEGEE